MAISIVTRPKSRAKVRGDLRPVSRSDRRAANRHDASTASALPQQLRSPKQVRPSQAVDEEGEHNAWGDQAIYEGEHNAVRDAEAEVAAGVESCFWGEALDCGVSSEVYHPFYPVEL